MGCACYDGLLNFSLNPRRAQQYGVPSLDCENVVGAFERERGPRSAMIGGCQSPETVAPYSGAARALGPLLKYLRSMPDIKVLGDLHGNVLTALPRAECKQSIFRM